MATAAKIPKAATWSLATGDTIGAKATLTPSATNWTHSYAVGAAIKIGFVGVEFPIVASGAAAVDYVECAAASCKQSNPMWIKSVAVDFKGYKDMSKDPGAAANTWYSTNQAALKGQSLDKYKVGSWAAIIKVVLGKNDLFTTSTGKMKNVYNGVGCTDNTASSKGIYAEAHVPTATTFTCAAAGAMGDYWSVALKATVEGGTAKPDTIYHGRFVKTAGNVTAGTYAAAVHENRTEFRAHDIPTVATAFTDLAASKLQGTKNTAALTVAQTFASAAFPSPFGLTASVVAADIGTVVTPGTLTVCDTAKWADATACHGVTTWQTVGTPTEPTNLVDGEFIFAHWLGDSLTTRDIFSVEAKDSWVLVVHEHRAAVGGASIGVASGTLSATMVYQSACTDVACKLQLSVEQDYWGISNVFAVGDKIGASSTVLGAAALLSMLSLF